MFLNAVSVMYAQSQKQPLSANLDSVKKANTEMWLKAQKRALEQMKDSELAEPMAELQKEEKDARLQKINEEIEAYKRLVSGVVKHSTPTFGIEEEQKAISDTCHIVSEQVIKEEGEKANTNIAPKCFAYEPTTFASQREILDFIKSIDFDRNPPAKRLCDFYNVEKKITEDKVLRKGIELYQKGKIKKAVDYFSKVSKNFKYTKDQLEYAKYQVAHYNYYGKFDIYYNGIPSQMDRTDASWKFERNVTCPLVPYLFMLAEPTLSTYDPIRLLSYIVTANNKYRREGYLYADNRNSLFTKDLLAALLYEAFPKGATLKTSKLNGITYGYDYKPMKYRFDEKTSTHQEVSYFCESISDFFNWMDCLHIIARTDWNQKGYYGIGLSANELYYKAKKINPYKQFNLFDYEKGAKNIGDRDEQCQVFLLRSAYFGHPDAMIELLPYIIATVQLGYVNGVRASKFFQKEYNKDYEGTKLFLNESALNSICAILGKNKHIDGLPKLEPLKDYAYIWEAMSETASEAFKQISKQYNDLISAQLAEERAKKERRKQFWTNVGTALLNGMASGVYAYMASQYQVSAPMNTVPQMTGNYPGSLADAMSQPGYFQQQQQQLLQLSMNQVQWAEMQEYNATRENYQRMGRDLTLNEFRSLKGQAIANLKEQGYDIIAEQKAINDDIRDFNRSQMNSGKENVERIKKQNADKSKVVASNTTNPKSKSFTSNSSAKPYTDSKPSSTSTTSGAKKNNNVSRNKASDSSPDAHEQYKKGNVNTQKSAYGDKIKNVSFSVKDGASYRSVNLHGELYKKDGQHFVLIGNSFFKVEHSGGSYNSYIIYGAKAHYFNK
jgi:hypothetical protein